VTSLSAIVPATDRPATLGACVAALEAASPDEVVVVDTPRNAGPAAARNAGVRRATGDLLVFVDSDVLVHDDAFERIRAAFAADGGLVALFGSYDDRVATRGTVAGFRNLLHHVVHQRSAGEATTFWAGLGAVRRGPFEGVGGFDASRYPHPSIEDIELGARLATKGRILLDPAVQGTHLKEWTLEGMIRTDFARRGVPWVELMLERSEVPASLNLGLRERASAAASLGAAAALLARRPVLAAAALAAQVTLNRDLYTLLLRRMGATAATAGVGLHAVHQLTAAASVPAGVAAHARRR
jgi:glycosyltransferase involved in cell wall biosynthesis